MSIAVPIQTCILKVSGLNTGWITGFSQSPLAHAHNLRHTIAASFRNCIYSYSNFIITFPFHSALYNLCSVAYCIRYSDSLLAGLRRTVVRFQAGTRDFSLFSGRFIPVLRATQLPVKLVQGAFSSGLKRPGREADHASLSSDEVKNEWIYNSNPPYAFIE
jgi:hypothetical protein